MWLRMTMNVGMLLARVLHGVAMTMCHGWHVHGMRMWVEDTVAAGG